MPVPAPVLIPFAHDWESPMERRLRYATAIIQSQDGSEQRMRRASVPSERLTMFVKAMDEGETLQQLATLASIDDFRALVPRWYDAAMLSVAAGAGSTALVVDRDVTATSLTGGVQAMLWLDQSDGTSRFSTEVVNVSAAADFGVTTGALADDWPAGTMIVPLATSRLVPPVTFDRLGPGAGSATLVFDVESPIIGIIDDPGTQTAVVASVQRAGHWGGLVIRDRASVRLRAVALDASGVRIANAPIEWTLEDNWPFGGSAPVGYLDQLSIWATGDPSIAVVKNVGGGTLYIRVRASSGGFSATWEGIAV